MKDNFFYILILFLLGILVSCKTSKEPIYYKYPNIVYFVEKQNERENIMMMDINGNNNKNLTRIDTINAYRRPIFSPNGSDILCISRRPNDKFLVLLNVNSSIINVLTKVRHSLTYYEFSPDGSKIVYTTQNDSNNSDIFIMNSDGTNIKNLTNNPPGIDIGSSVFSPDGNNIIYIDDTNGNSDIFMMDLDGNNIINITKSEIDEGSPIISPDGSKMIFVSFENTTLLGTYILNSDSSKVELLTDSRLYISQFTADSKKILYIKFDYGPKIYMMNLETRKSVLLADNSAPPSPWTIPKISPDGKKIIYVDYDYINNSNNIWIMDIDGNNKMQLTYDEYYKNLGPVFQP
jgi:TolB protein